MPRSKKIIQLDSLLVEKLRNQLRITRQKSLEATRAGDVLKVGQLTVQAQILIKQIADCEDMKIIQDLEK